MHACIDELKQVYMHAPAFVGCTHTPLLKNHEKECEYVLNKNKRGAWMRYIAVPYYTDDMVQLHAYACMMHR